MKSRDYDQQSSKSGKEAVEESENSRPANLGLDTDGTGDMEERNVGARGGWTAIQNVGRKGSQDDIVTRVVWIFARERRSSGAARRMAGASSTIGKGA